MNDKFLKLAEPFEFKDIEWRLVYSNEQKMKGQIVPYVTSRAIQDRLDNIFGITGWKNEFLLWQNSDSQLCAISIYDEEKKEWISKYDGAPNTSYEAVKGGLSDAFKRAGVMWKIGRYLYRFPKTWADIEKQGKGYKIQKGQEKGLEAAYNQFVKEIENKSKIQEFISLKINASTNGATPTAPSHGNLPKEQSNLKTTQTNQDESQYKIMSFQPSGNAICLKLMDAYKNEIIAYVPNGSPGINNGVVLSNVKLKENTGGPLGKYYTISEYNAA